jgi:hypothetical protein
MIYRSRYLFDNIDIDWDCVCPKSKWKSEVCNDESWLIEVLDKANIYLKSKISGDKERID